MIRISSQTRTALAFVSVLNAACLGNALADTTDLDCEAVADFAKSVDVKDRWYPVPADRYHGWLPKRFASDDFEHLVGKPPLDLSPEEVDQARREFNRCYYEARKAGRKDEVRPLLDLYNLLNRPLKRIITLNEQTTAKLGPKLDSMEKLPASAKLLQALALLREVDISERSAVSAAYHKAQRLRTPEGRIAAIILRSLPRLTGRTWKNDFLPRIADLEGRARADLLGALEKKITALPPTDDGRTQLDAILAEGDTQLGPYLSADDKAALEQTAAQKRAEMNQGVVADLERRIDEAADTRAGLAGIGQVLQDPKMGLLSTAQAQAVREHARPKQEAIAAGVLDEGLQKLAALPGPLAPAEALGQIAGVVSQVKSDAGAFLSPDKVAGLERAAEEKRARIEDAVAADLEQRMAADPDTAEGLHSVGAILQDPAFKALSDERAEKIRDHAQARQQAIAAAVLEAATASIADLPGSLDNLQALKRLSTIYADVKKAAGSFLSPEALEGFRNTARAKRGEIEEALVADLKARMDALPSTADGLHQLVSVLHDPSVRALGHSTFQELRAYGLERGHEIADGALQGATDKLADFPDTLEGMHQLEVYEQKTLSELKKAASEQAVVAFEGAVKRRASEQGRAALPEFRKRLAAIPENREGLKEAEAQLKMAHGYPRFDEETRGLYAAAAEKRRDEIAAGIRAQFEAQRAEAIAAGGDPDLVGYTFKDETGMAQLRFRDEKWVEVFMMGIKFPAKYEVDGTYISIQGPNGVLNLEHEGDALSGMGLEYHRVE